MRKDFRNVRGGSFLRTRDFCPVCHTAGVSKKVALSGVVAGQSISACCGGLVFKDFASFLTQIEFVEYTFPIPMTNDNDGGSRHFKSNPARDRRRRRTAIEDELRAYGFFRYHPPLYKQRVTLTRVLGPRQALWDWDSVLRGNAKEIIDALAALKFFLNDSPRWIVGVAGEQDGDSRDLGQGVRITIVKAE